MQEFFTVIVTSSLTATIATTVINAWLEHRKSNSIEIRDTLKIAIALEGYAMECADKIGDHETAVSADGHAGQYLASVPDLPDIEVPFGLSRHRKLAAISDVLVFAQELIQAEQAVDFWWNVVGDIDCCRNEAVQQASQMGLRSIVIARKVRRAFSLPARELVFGGYDVESVLKKSNKSSE